MSIKNLSLKRTVLAFCMLSFLTGSAQYNEKYRPQFHLSSKSSSMADPKGLFIFDSTYHLFWYGQWEHAVSRDLIHWKELPKPMKGAPRSFSYFTGSVVVDKKNSSGFGNNSVIAIYTRHFPGDSLPETQSISISRDSGKEFHYYEQNPVLDINKKYFRDPQVFWHEPSKLWKMVVALPDQHQIPIYESKNLKDWNFCSSFGEIGAKNSFWECPDFFELPVLGSKRKKWVMIIGRGPNKVQYFIGDFDGKVFTPDPEIADYLRLGKGLKGFLYEDFEGSTLSKWQKSGNAFLNTESIGAIDYLGKSYAGNISKNQNTGLLRSAPFTIKYNAINFLIAGGEKEDSLCLRLVINNKVYRSTSGDKTKVFKWNGWDVRDLKGKQAHLELVDLSADSINGSIGVDHIMFADNILNLQTEHALWLDYGEDFYATKTWRNYDEKKNMGDSIILISWLGNWRYARLSPTSWGTGFQSVPRNVTLKKFPEGLRVVQEPIPELRRLRKSMVQIKNRTIIGITELKEFQPLKNTYEIEAVFSTVSSGAFGFNLLVGEGRKLSITYDPKISSLCVDRSNCTDFITNPDFTKRFSNKMYAHVEPEGKQIKFHILVDQSSIELFTDQGKVSLSAVTYPSDEQRGIQLFSEKGSAQLISFKGWELSSIWKEDKAISTLNSVR